MGGSGPKVWKILSKKNFSIQNEKNFSANSDGEQAATMRGLAEVAVDTLKAHRGVTKSL